MRTTAELSKLTGVPKRTLQHWSQERKQNAKGQEVGGAGILPSTVNPQNGYRVFSDDALARVLMIMLAKEAGCNQEDIRGLMDSLESGVGSAVGGHIDRMEAERKELERKIQLAKAIEEAQKALVSVRGSKEGPEAACSENTKAAAEFSLVSKVIALAVMDFLESLSRHAPDVPPKALSDALEDWLSGGYSAMLLELFLGEGSAQAAFDAVRIHSGMQMNSEEEA